MSTWMVAWLVVKGEAGGREATLHWSGWQPDVGSGPAGTRVGRTGWGTSLEQLDNWSALGNATEGHVRCDSELHAGVSRRMLESFIRTAGCPGGAGLWSRKWLLSSVTLSLSCLVEYLMGTWRWSRGGTLRLKVDTLSQSL